MTSKQKIIKVNEELENRLKNLISDANLDELKIAVNEILGKFPKKEENLNSKRNVNCTGLGMLREPTEKLINFMEDATEYSYLSLNKRICNYVKENNLQKEKNKKIFYIDDFLRELLNISSEVQELSFTSIMAYYTSLFIQPTFKINETIAQFATDEVELPNWFVGAEKTVYEIQQMIYKYIKKNKLENNCFLPLAKSKKKICLDEKLKDFLKAKNNEITQIQFEKYIKNLIK